MSCGDIDLCDHCDECRGCGCQCEKRVLRAALEAVQWGLADDMGTQRICPECEGSDPKRTYAGDLGGHMVDCIVGKALA